MVGVGGAVLWLRASLATVMIGNGQGKSMAAETEQKRSNQIPVWVSIVLGTVVLILSTLNTWVERQLLDTDRWVDTSTALLDDDDVREELSVRLVNALYENADVGAAIDEELPEDLQGLGDPLAGVLRSPLTNTVDTLLQSGPVQAIWEEANRTAHEAVTAILEDDVGDNISTSGGTVVIDLGALLAQVAEQIGLPDSVIDAIPEDAGQFEVVDSDRLEDAQTAVTTIKLLSVVWFLVVIILYGAAIYLAHTWRRETIRNVGFATALGGLVVLIALRLGIGVIADSPDTPGGRAAADSILTIGSALLRQLGWSEVVIGLLLALGASLIGPTRYATWVREYTATAFRRFPVATWIGLVVVVLIVLTWSPFTAAGNWLTVLIVVTLVIVGVEALRRTSLAEEPHPEKANADPETATASAESGADAT